MNKLFNKEKILFIHENFKIIKNNIIWIHHPITEDLINVKVEESNRDYLIVSILKDSDYYGQPNFKIKKTQVLGIK